VGGRVGLGARISVVTCLRQEWPGDLLREGGEEDESHGCPPFFISRLLGNLQPIDKHHPLREPNAPVGCSTDKDLLYPKLD
jgi:hypothetical protein